MFCCACCSASETSTQSIACAPACTAAILVLQHVLLPSGQYEWPDLLAHVAGWYDSGHVYDWSTSDWLCIRVLHNVVIRCKEEQQRQACCKVSDRRVTWAHLIMTWRSAWALVATLLAAESWGILVHASACCSVGKCSICPGSC